VGGELRIDSTADLFTNPAALLPLAHITAGAFLVAGFFMAGISAWHLRRSRLGAPVHLEFFRRSLRIGLASAVVAVVPSAVFGGLQFSIGPESEDKSALSGVAAELMMTAWLWMFLVAVAALVKLPFTGWLLRGRAFLRVVMMTLPVPYAAMMCGWIYRETGRQPWLIQGVLRTEDAVRPMGHGAMLATTVGVSALFVVLAVVNIVLLRRFARRGPDTVALGAPAPAEGLDPVPSL
jgi:cytochrome d ubiquinol oxidase subunit I